MKQGISRILNINKNKKIKINYEVLKKHLRYEDIFYELYLKPICNEHGFEISFDNKFVVLTPKNKKEK